jgi:hypothetical protein
VEKVVGNDLIPAVGSLLEAPGIYRVALQKRIESNRHGVDID